MNLIKAVHGRETNVKLKSHDNIVLKHKLTLIIS